MILQDIRLAIAQAYKETYKTDIGADDLPFATNLFYRLGAMFDKELEETRQIVNSERLYLIVKKTEQGLNQDETKRLKYLKKKVNEWWPRGTFNCGTCKYDMCNDGDCQGKRWEPKE